MTLASSKTVYPGDNWEVVSPSEVGFNQEKLDSIRRWLDDNVGEERYRAVIVRGGKLVAEWRHGIGVDEQLWMTSATKSIFSSILGIAIAEGKIPSIDSKIIDYYPEALEVSEGEGPKPGRYAFEKDRSITFGHLITNTSGYMKPGEEPGSVFHYQTFGMNILTHAIAKVYGFYDVSDPEGSIGFKRLVDEKISHIIGACWGYYTINFGLHPKARINTFGYYDGVQSNALDMARLGWLWRNWGRWEERQVIPEKWMREATHVVKDIRANCPPEQWKYGYGFWTNEYGKLWPALPTDSYSAAGAGGQNIWVCPGLDVVVAQSPGIRMKNGNDCGDFLKKVVDACD